MPLPTSSLTKKSGKKAVRNAISRCISQEFGGDRPHKQVLAMCIDDAREHAGSRFIPKRVKVVRKKKS